jgi:hypothetical protein
MISSSAPSVFQELFTGFCPRVFKALCPFSPKLFFSFRNSFFITSTISSSCATRCLISLIKSSAESPKLGEQRMIMIEHVSITNVRMPTPLRNPVTNGEERNFFSVLRRPTLRVSWRLLRWQDVSELPRARCAVGGQLDPRVRRSVASMFASTKIRRSTMR